MIRSKSPGFDDGSFRSRYGMRPSIARMTLDLGYGELGMDSSKKDSASEKATKALQHRLAELLVFEIRQDG